MGVWVGALVGAFVGALVQDAVGAWVRAWVGACVGASEGASVATQHVCTQLSRALGALQDAGRPDLRTRPDVARHEHDIGTHALRREGTRASYWALRAHS